MDTEDGDGDVSLLAAMRVGGQISTGVEPNNTQRRGSNDQGNLCFVIANAFQRCCLHQSEEERMSGNSEIAAENSESGIANLLKTCAGPPLSLAAGEVLIEQGQASKGIYLILEGSLVLTRETRGNSTGSSNSMSRESIRGGKSTEYTVLGEGSLLGEMSFLLNTPSLFTVRVPRTNRRSSLRVSSNMDAAGSFTGRLKTSASHSSPGSVLAESSGASFIDNSPSGQRSSFKGAGSVVLAALDYDTVKHLIATDPKLTQRLFHAMSIHMSRRVIAASDFKISNASEELVTEQEAKDSNELLFTSMSKGAGGVNERSAYEIARAFGVPMSDADMANAQLLSSVGPCRVMEESSTFLSTQSVSTEPASTIYLFQTHLCIEEPGFMLFNKRRTIPLEDVLRLLQGPMIAPPSVPNMNAQQRKLSLSWQTVELQMKGTSLHIAMDADTCARFQVEVERARLRHTNMTHLEENAREGAHLMSRDSLSSPTFGRNSQVKFGDSTKDASPAGPRRPVPRVPHSSSGDDDSFQSFKGGRSLDKVKGFRAPGLRSFLRQGTQSFKLQEDSDYSSPSLKREGAGRESQGIFAWMFSRRSSMTESGQSSRSSRQSKRSQRWLRDSGKRDGSESDGNKRESNSRRDSSERDDSKRSNSDGKRLSSDTLGASWAKFNEKRPGAHSALNSQLTDLTELEWTSLLKGARYKDYQRNQKIIVKGRSPGGLLQVVRGTVRLEVDLPGRPQAQVIGRLNAGEILGEMSFLLGDPPAAAAVCESDTAAVIRLPAEYLKELFASSPSIAAKFYYFLTLRAAERLRSVTRKEEVELVYDQASKAPKSIEAIYSNVAYAAIIDKFIRASPEREKEFGNVSSFIRQVLLLQKEGDPALVFAHVKRIYDRFVAEKAKQAIAPLFLAAKTPTGVLRSSITGSSVISNAREAFITSTSNHIAPHILRHLYDPLLAKCYKLIQGSLLNKFVRSPHYDYILNLNIKENQPVSLDDFKVCDFLGEGSFGQVIEVIKRDCGQRYAMKIMSKKDLLERFGTMWEAVSILERSVLGQLHHPLLINLAYAFQNVDYLVLVMDLCEGGDLSVYGVSGDSKLNSTALRFCVTEIFSAILHLTDKRIMHRDIKPANLMVDRKGNIKLIDFGTAKMSQSDEPPTSSEECGTRAYMAPEVRTAEKRGLRYDSSCDLFSFGATVYELAEQEYPFGPFPIFKDMNREFRQPDLLDENGVEIEGLFNFVSGLLDWDPKTRHGGDGVGGIWTLKNDPYWYDTDWEAAVAGRMKSPLLEPFNGRLSKSPTKRRRATVVGNASQARSKAFVESFAASKKRELAAAKLKVGNSTPPTLTETFDEEELETYVEGWEFSSKHALAQEYVASASAVVSMV